MVEELVWVIALLPTLKMVVLDSDNSAKRYGGGLTVADENTLNFTGKMYSVVTQLTLTLVEELL